MVNNLLRKLKIRNVLPVEFTDNEKNIVDFLDNNIRTLSKFEYDEFPKSIFHMSINGKWILEENGSNIYVRWNGFWETLNNNKSLTYHRQIEVLSFYIKSYLNRKAIKIKTDFDGNFEGEEAEKAYKKI